MGDYAHQQKDPPPPNSLACLLHPLHYWRLDIFVRPKTMPSTYSILLSHLPSYCTISCTSIEFVCDQHLLSVAETYGTAHVGASQNGRSTM